MTFLKILVSLSVSRVMTLERLDLLWQKFESLRKHDYDYDKKTWALNHHLHICTYDCKSPSCCDSRISKLLEYGILQENWCCKNILLNTKD